MINKIVKPEDMIPDHKDSVVVGDITVRKGTAAAIFSNAKILSSHTATLIEKEAAKAMITEYAPGFLALGVYDLISWKNPEVQKIFDEIAEKLKENK